eukprot:g12085.t2
MASAERDGLEVLFRLTGGDSWKEKAKWATDAELSTWHGVTVEDGRVTVLYLDDNNLRGPIPEVVGAATNLKKLSLSTNQLGGPIPEALGALTNLTQLYLYRSRLTGPLPEALGALTNLTKLHLHGNQLTGPIPEALGALSSLMELNLGINQLTGPISVAVALISLKKLNLGINQLTGAIPEGLGDLTNLTEVNIRRNKLTGPIPAALGALTNLTELYLQSNQLTEPIPAAFEALTNLTVVNVRRNQLSGSIPEALGALTNLTRLYLHSNQLTGPIPAALGALTNLTEVNVRHNQLTGPIPAVLGALTNLTELYLQSNQLTGSIPEALGALTNLTKLFLHSNQLTGSIPEALGALTNLTQLHLGVNQLTGPLPEGIEALSNLTEVNFCRNQLEGPIPDTVGALTNLTNLYLHSNQLTGALPNALGALTNLTTLNIGINQLTGPIPQALGALTSLTKVYLHSNQLAGPVPEFLGALPNLTKIHLDGNKLTGPVPETFGALTNLTELNLCGNQLTGPIPHALGALTNLTELSLGINQLTGTVPLSVWKLPLLRTLDFSGNLLTHFTDPQEKNAPALVALEQLERVERRIRNLPFQSGAVRTKWNPWEFPPAAVVANGLESIKRYYDTWEQCDFSLVEIHALKLVFVGAHGAGKTSLARSIKMGRGDRTPEIDDNGRTTVGVDLYSHELRDGTECKIYDVAGQITYYGLHQFFLTERAVYVIVFDATKFEGLSGKELDKAVDENILEWVSSLHMRAPVCNVMLAASHFDMLHGATHQQNKQLLVTVEERFSELHAKWKSLRHRQGSNMDTRMTILPGVFPVGCKLASESADYTSKDGLQAVEEALLSNQMAVVSRVPLSWVAARQVLDKLGTTNGDGFGEKSAVDGCRRPWELRPVIHTAFKSFVEEGRRNASEEGCRRHPASRLLRLQEDGIRHSMDGAIELKAFSGTVISHDVFVVLDVRWLSGVLKPILDHRGITRNEMGVKVFAGRELNTSHLLTWASELVGRGVLRKGFARFLWSLTRQVTEGADCPHEVEPGIFEEILEELGVTIPLPETPSTTALTQNLERTPPATAKTKSAGHLDVASRWAGVDLLVIMRLPLKADANMRDTLLLAKQAALNSSVDSVGHKSLKAVFEFDHAGAPHGLPERVMALSHKIGMFSPRARWRLGGLFLLHNGVDSNSSMILEYDKESKTFCIEALGQTTSEVKAVQFVVSALFHVSRHYPGASWTGWIECSMGHDGEKMYNLATPHEKQNLTPGSEIVPLTRDSASDRGRKQRNMCTMQGLEPRGSCTIDPDDFGRVLDVMQPFEIFDQKEERFDGLEDRLTSPNLSDLGSTVSTTRGMEYFNRKLAVISESQQVISESQQVISENQQEMLRRTGTIDGKVDRILTEQLNLRRRVAAMSTVLEHLAMDEMRMPHTFLVFPEEQTKFPRPKQWFADRGRLRFVCTHGLELVPCGEDGTGFLVSQPKEWMKKHATLLQVTVMAILATAAVADAAASGGALGRISASLSLPFEVGTLEDAYSFLSDVGGEEMGSILDNISDALDPTKGEVGVATNKRAVKEVTGAEYRSVLNYLDRHMGGMERALSADGVLGWVCRQHRSDWESTEVKGAGATSKRQAMPQLTDDGPTPRVPKMKAAGGNVNAAAAAAAAAAEAAAPFMTVKTSETGPKNELRNPDGVSGAAIEDGLNLYHKIMAHEDPKLKEALESAMQVLRDSLRLYGPDQLIGSYNGGKDAVVIMHLQRAAVAKYSVEKGLAFRTKLIYFENDREFPEVEELVNDNEERYDLELARYGTGFVEGLKQRMEEGGADKCYGFVLGTRKGDPNCGVQTSFTPSSDWMPAFMRVNPILDWDYGQVWTFLRDFGLPYCSLYDEGYTSLGNLDNTFPNPYLRKRADSTAAVPAVGGGDKEGGDERVGDEYLPAYRLLDWSLERAGRGERKADTLACELRDMESRRRKVRHARSAGLVVIGDEVLKGKCQDLNTAFATHKLWEKGIPVQRVAVVQDDADAICNEVRRQVQEFDLVITSGGVGPTHDDITIFSVARALNQKVRENKDMVDKLLTLVGVDSADQLSEAQLKMAMLPELSKLRVAPLAGEKAWPILQTENVFILPGVPEFFQSKMSVIADHFLDSRPMFVRKIVLSADEFLVVGLLNKAVEEHPTVTFGSYPYFSNPAFKTVITLEGEKQDDVTAATEALQQSLPEEYVVKVVADDDLMDV